MRIALLTLGVAVAIIGVDARALAQNYPWCAIYAKDGDSHCAFSTQDQCMATVSGIGGFCVANASAPATDRAARTSKPVR